QKYQELRVAWASAGLVTVVLAWPAYIVFIENGLCQRPSPHAAPLRTGLTRLAMVYSAESGTTVARGDIDRQHVCSSAYIPHQRRGSAADAKSEVRHLPPIAPFNTGVIGSAHHQQANGHFHLRHYLA
ncbi:hypothetical protein WI666_18905, partial [Vibrio cholerae]